jgi:Gram-negative bacterial TonB protein C-terminal
LYTFRPDPAALPIVRRVVIDTDLREIETKHQVGMRHSYPAIAAAPSARSGLNSPFANPSLSNETAGDREVIIQVLVNTKGKVTDARAIKGSPYLQVQGATAAWKWEFKPYLVAGQPTEFYTELEFF